MIETWRRRDGHARRVPLVAIAIALIGSLLVGSAARPAGAAAYDIIGDWSDTTLQTPLIGQWFTQADPPAAPGLRGDTGLYDCLPASLTMAMSVLQSTTLSLGAGVGSYISVRDGARFAAGETIVVEHEHMAIISISPHATVGAGFSMSPDGTSDMYVTRGTDNTTVAPHPAGTFVQRPADYGSVRRAIRATSKVPPDHGLGQTYGEVEAWTDGRFTADDGYEQTSADQWMTTAEDEIQAGRPLVLYIADPTLLNDSTGQAPRPANEDFGAHAVLLAGIVDDRSSVIIDDPWNPSPVADPIGAGRQFKMSTDDFLKAWGSTRYGSNAAWRYIAFKQVGGGALAAPVVSQAQPAAVSPPPAVSAPAAPKVVGSTGMV